MERICISPADVAFIVGRSERYGRDLINKIKQELGKAAHQQVSFCELATHLGLSKEYVFKIINRQPVMQEEE